MKNALLILDHFPPSFAPRMGYLSKYLKDTGWDAYAISMPHPVSKTGFESLAHFIESEEIKETRWFGNHKINRLAIELYGLTRLRRLWSYNDELMYRTAKEILKKRQFDAVLCSTASFFPLLCASRIAEEYGLPLLTDLRDIYEQNDNFLTHRNLSTFLRKMQIKRRNRILKKSAAVSTVSPWHRNLLSEINPDTRLIYNGFDPDLFRYTQPEKTEKFTITYTGTVPAYEHDSTRSPELLFKAIAELYRSGHFAEDSVRVRFYTNSPSREFVNAYVEKYGLGDIADIHGWVDSEKIPQILSESNILLILSSELLTHGILTTKVFEYMAANREILCIPNSGGDLQELINRANAGCCTDSYPELRNYLKFKYDEWKKTGIVKSHSDPDFVSAFSRERQAIQFAGILYEISGK